LFEEWGRNVNLRKTFGRDEIDILLDLCAYGLTDFFKGDEFPLVDFAL
jgi:hypothetical protein